MGGGVGDGGWFSMEIMTLRGPILQAELCQIFSWAEAEDRAECGNIC